MLTKNSASEHEEAAKEGYLIASAYGIKYGIPKRQVAYLASSGALLAKKFKVYDPHMRSLQYRWHIKDISPDLHPASIDKKTTYDGKLDQRGDGSPKARNSRILSQLKTDAPRLLENFIAKAPAERSRFNVAELTSILGVRRERVKHWITVGVEGWGKLPTVYVPDAVNRKYEGRIDYYITRRDVVRFLRGDFKDGMGKFATIDDAFDDSIEAEELKIENGFFSYSVQTVYPKSYEGFAKWCREKCRRYDRKLRQWVPIELLPNQVEFFKNALTLNDDGTLKHKFVCTSRPRGDFKSFDCGLLILYRFFNFPRESILLAANSQDQSDYVLYSEIRRILENSPDLRSTPGLEIKEKGIFLYSSKKEVFSSIKTIASKIGTLSNSTCIGFSEIYKLRDEDFFVELMGSIRGVPDAMIVVESTVSPKGHVFHRMYEQYQKGEDPLLYFQYYADKHYNPYMTVAELKSYQRTMYERDFNRFFRNRWEDAFDGFFIQERIFEMGVYGVDGENFRTPELIQCISSWDDMRKTIKALERTNQRAELDAANTGMKGILKRFKYCDGLYHLPATREHFEEMCKIMGSECIVGVGLDRAQAYSKNPDRTVLSCVARFIISEFESIVFVLDLFVPKISRLDVLTAKITEYETTYGWVDAIDLETYQAQDLFDWCTDQGYNAQLITATNKEQDEIFRNMYMLVDGGLLKCPSVPYWQDDESILHAGFPPVGREDVLRQEMEVFEANTDTTRNRYGAPNKRKKGHPLDDCVYSLAWALRAAFRESIGMPKLGGSNLMAPSAMVNEDVIGEYDVLRNKR